MCPCGKAVESRAHTVGGCDIYKEERNVLEETSKIDECGMETFGTLDSSQKTIAILRRYMVATDGETARG